MFPAGIPSAIRSLRGICPSHHHVEQTEKNDEHHGTDAEAHPQLLLGVGLLGRLRAVSGVAALAAVLAVLLLAEALLPVRARLLAAEALLALLLPVGLLPLLALLALLA